jgi:AraC-like DNA-binding protein
MAKSVEFKMEGGLGAQGESAVGRRRGTSAHHTDEAATGAGDGPALARFPQIKLEEWQSMVHSARYCVKQLAQHNHTSVRTLQRHILAMTGERPHQWMRHLRMARAVELLADNSKVEWVTGELGYISRHHFARDFKKYWGYPPSEHARRVKLGAARQVIHASLRRAGESVNKSGTPLPPAAGMQLPGIAPAPCSTGAR